LKMNNIAVPAPYASLGVQLQTDKASTDVTRGPLMSLTANVVISLV